MLKLIVFVNCALWAFVVMPWPIAIVALIVGHVIASGIERYIRMQQYIQGIIVEAETQQQPPAQPAGFVTLNERK